MNKYKAYAIIASINIIFFNTDFSNISFIEKNQLMNKITLAKIKAIEQEVNLGNYTLIIDESNDVIAIKEYSDDSYDNLVTYYKIKAIPYNEESSIEDFLSNILEESSINNNRLSSKKVYKNNALIQSINYQKNVEFNESNLDNTNNYETVFDINNNLITKITSYYKDSSIPSKIYTMNNNVTFNNKIEGYKSILLLNTNNQVTSLEEYNNNTISKITEYYPSSINTYTNNKKQELFFNQGYLVKEMNYFTNQIISSYVLYYSNTKNDSNKNKHVLERITNDDKGYITKHVRYADNTQKQIRTYAYEKNTTYTKNESIKLTEITYFTFNRGKQVKTGYQTYYKGKLIKSYVMLKDVPYFNQVTGGYRSGCEFFSLKMALGYKGSNVSAKTLYNRLAKSNNKPKYKNGKWYWANPDKMFLGNPKGKMYNNADWGINPLGLLPLAKRYQPNSFVKDNASLDYIQSQLQEGNPVIVWGSFRFNPPAGFFNYIDSDGNKRFTYGNYHVFLIIGMDDKYVYISDPILGSQKITKKQLKQSYTKYGKRILVVQ